MLLLTSNLYCIVNLTQAGSSGRGLPVNSMVPNFDIDVTSKFTKYFENLLRHQQVFQYDLWSLHPKLGHLSARSFAVCKDLWTWHWCASMSNLENTCNFWLNYPLWLSAEWRRLDIVTTPRTGHINTRTSHQVGDTWHAAACTGHVTTRDTWQHVTIIVLCTRKPGHHSLLFSSCFALPLSNSFGILIVFEGIMALKHHNNYLLIHYIY